MASQCCGPGGGGGSAFTCADLNICSIGALLDVDVSGLNDSDVLGWNAASGKFLPISTIGGPSICSFDLVGMPTPTALVTVTTTASGAEIKVDVLGGSGGSAPCTLEIVAGASINVTGVGSAIDPAIISYSGPAPAGVAQWNGDNAIVVVSSVSDPWYAPTAITLVSLSIGLGTVGVGDVTVDLLVNGVVVATTTAVAGAYTLVPFSLAVAQGARLDAHITSAGINHVGISYQVLYEF